MSYGLDAPGPNLDIFVTPTSQVSTQKTFQRARQLRRQPSSLNSRPTTSATELWRPFERVSNSSSSADRTSSRNSVPSEFVKCILVLGQCLPYPGLLPSLRADHLLPSHRFNQIISMALMIRNYSLPPIVMGRRGLTLPTTLWHTEAYQSSSLPWRISRTLRAI